MGCFGKAAALTKHQASSFVFELAPRYVVAWRTGAPLWRALSPKWISSLIGPLHSFVILSLGHAYMVFVIREIRRLILRAKVCSWPILLTKSSESRQKQRKLPSLRPGDLLFARLYRTSVFRPFLHHRTALLKQIGSEVCRFHLVLPTVRQCLLTDLTRITCRLR